MSSRKDHFSSSPCAGALVDAIIALLDYACVWSPIFGSASADPPASVGLVFEILRSEKAIFDVGTWATSLGRESALKPASATDECRRNLRTVVAHFSEPITKRRQALGEAGQMEPEEVIAIIRQYEESLDLEDSPALEDIRCARCGSRCR